MRAKRVTEGEEPEPEIVSDEQMLRDFKVGLHTALMRGELKGTALSQGLNSIAKMVPPPPPEPEDTRPFNILDQLGALPKTEGQRLLRQEIVRVRAQLAELEAAVIKKGS